MRTLKVISVFPGHLNSIICYFSLPLLTSDIQCMATVVCVVTWAQVEVLEIIFLGVARAAGSLQDGE